MNATLETTTIHDLLARARTLSAEGRRRLADLLKREQDEPFPDRASIDEAIELYLADVCSLGRAAEIAGVTRWDIIGRLKERHISIPVAGEESAEEMDALAAELKREGIL